MRRLHGNSANTLKYKKPDKELLKIASYSDASVASNADNTCQLVYFIFLAEKYNTCQPIYWTSYKTKRVSPSVL